MIRVTENDKKLLHEETFFFQHIVIFEGKKSMVYQIIFENSGTNKLITMSFKAITENTHIANVITP